MTPDKPWWRDAIVIAAGVVPFVLLLILVLYAFWVSM